MSDLADQELVLEPVVRPADVRLAAMDLLARREHSRRELRQKLLKRFRKVELPELPELIDEQLDHLAGENLQSDTRYAESFLRQRVQRGQGPLRIRQEMRQKGIPDSEVCAAMEAGDYDWFALAAEVLERKFGGTPAEDMKERARRIRFMQYRGFESDHFRDYLN